MGDFIDVSTQNNLQYQFYPVSSGSVQFKVRAVNDAHIALTMGPQESDPMYEVMIGGWRNTKSVIRRNRTKPDKVEIETPGIINGGEFRGFWVRWDSGIISAGREGETIPFMSWSDPEPIPVNFVGVCTGRGATGTWTIESGELHWVRMTRYDDLPRDAMIGGFENEPIYIARANHHGSVCPGKYVPSKKLAYVPWGHREHAKEDFEILCGFNAAWISTRNDYIPENAFVAGTSEVRGAPLYIGRAMHDGYLLTGKVHTLYKSCYFPYKGNEIEIGRYDILVMGNITPRGSFGPYI